MEARLIDHMGSDLAVVNAARVSMGKESKWEYEQLTAEQKRNMVRPKQILAEKDVKLINYLAKHQHMTPFEHCNVTLHLKVPIFVARQIHRHRTFTYSEVSRRYVDNDLEFYTPDSWRKRANNVKQGSSEEIIEEDCTTWGPTNVYGDGREAALSAYQELLEMGVAPEQARMVLPQSLYTEFYMSGNLRNWAHFLKLRLDPHAQVEARDIAQQCADLIKPLFPISYEALMR